MLHAFLIAFLMSWSWRRWIDVEVDGGWNLYSFWKVSEGQVLYRDFHSSFGPFSVYFCSWLFRIFGVSLRTLALSDSFLVFLMAQMIYGIFRRLGDHASALVVSCSFLVVFCFGQYQGFANGNFITPYKFEVLHGSLLLVALVWLLPATRRWPIFLAGVCWGASVTTCVEFAMASTAVVALWLASSARARAAVSCRSLGALFLGAALVPFVFFVFFVRYFSVPEALFHVFGALLAPLRHSALVQSKFYQHLLGLDKVAENGKHVAQALAAYAGSLALSAALARFTRALSLAYRNALGLVLAAAFLFFVYLPFSDLAALSLRGLPVIVALGSVWGYFRQPRIGFWAVFALVLSLRSAMNLELMHYGFYLAMPSALFAIFFATCAWPRWLNQRGWNGQTVRIFSLGAVLVFAIGCFQRSNLAYQSKNMPVGDGADTILGFDTTVSPDPAGFAVAVDWISAHTPPFASVLALPDGLMINYLSRRSHPGQATMFYLAYAMLGEDAILDPWRHNPPDYVVLVDRDLSEYGAPPFGESNEYGKKTLEWVRLRYRTEKMIGTPPLRGNHQFGIEILRKI